MTTSQPFLADVRSPNTSAMIACHARRFSNVATCPYRRRSGVISRAVRVFPGLVIPLRESFPCRDVCLTGMWSVDDAWFTLDPARPGVLAWRLRYPGRSPRWNVRRSGHSPGIDPRRTPLAVSHVSPFGTPADARDNRCTAPYAMPCLVPMVANTRIRQRSNHRSITALKRVINDGLAPCDA